MNTHPTRRMRIAMIFCLLLPLLVLGAMTVKNYTDLERGTRWQVKIAGYDPRHILQGRYLTYQYVWNLADKKDAQTESLCPIENGPCCACLQEGAQGRTDPLVTFHACTDETLPSCAGMIRGHDEWGGFSFGKNQFFIPERDAATLERLLQSGKHDFHMEINIPRAGQAVLAGLLIDGKNWRDALKEQAHPQD